MEQPRVFTVPKLGNSTSENEDAVNPVELFEPPGWFLAMSDGATESVFAREWASILVKSSFRDLMLSGKQTRQDRTDSWLANCRQEFESITDESSLPWYARAKLKQGAFATFLGLELSPHSRGGYWSAVAFGDTCVFQVRRGTVIRSFPILEASEFGNRPNLLTSNARQASPLLLKIREHSSGFDNFVVATDAIAAWLISDETKRERIKLLLDCQSDEAFCEFVSTERSKGSIKNDDCTVAIFPPRR